MNLQENEREILQVILGWVSKIFLSNDEEMHQRLSEEIDKIAIPKQTRFYEIISSLRDAIQTGLQIRRYDPFSPEEDQDEKIDQASKKELEAWKKASEQLHRLGEEKLGNLAKAWVHKCLLYMKEGKPSDLVREAYSASKLFASSGEDKIAAIIFADVLTRELFPRYSKYELSEFISHRELIPRFLLFKWIEISEQELCTLVSQHVETLLGVIDNQTDAECIRCMIAIRKILPRASDGQLLSAVKVLVKKWSNKRARASLQALVRKGIIENLSNLYFLIAAEAKEAKTQIFQVIKEALEEEDKDVRGVAIRFFNSNYSSLELRRRYWVARKTLDFLVSSDPSLKEAGFSLLSEVNLSVLKLRKQRSDLLHKIKVIGDSLVAMFKKDSKTGLRTGNLSDAFLNIGGFYESLDEEKSLDFLKYSIESSMHGVYHTRQDSLIIKVAVSYAKKKRWHDQAEFWHNLSEIKLAKENYRGAVVLLKNAAFSHLRGKDETKALSALQRILRIAEKQKETGKTWHAVLSYKSAAEIYLALKLRDEALEMAWRMEEIAEKAGILALKEAAELYHTFGMNAEASAILKRMLTQTTKLQRVDVSTSFLIETLTDVVAFHEPIPRLHFDNEEDNLDQTSDMFDYGFPIPESFLKLIKSDEYFSARVHWLQTISDMMFKFGDNKGAMEIAQKIVLMAEKPGEFGNPSEWDRQFAFTTPCDMLRSLGEIKVAAILYEKAASIFSRLGKWNLKRIPPREIFASLYLDARKTNKSYQISDLNSKPRDFLTWATEAYHTFYRFCQELGLSSPGFASNLIDPCRWAANCFENAAFCLRKAADDYLDVGLNEKAFQCYKTALQHNTKCHREHCISSEAESSSFFEKHSKASKLYNLIVDQARIHADEDETGYERWKIKYYLGLAAIEEGEGSVLQGRRSNVIQQFKKGIQLLDDAKKLAKDKVLLSQIPVCTFRLTYARARLKIEQGFVDREYHRKYGRAINNFKKAESLFGKLVKSELTNQEKMLISAYEMLAKAQEIITESIMFKDQKKLVEARATVEEAISIFSELSHTFRRAMRKKSEEWTNGVIACLRAMIAGQTDEREIEAISNFEKARAALSEVLGEETVKRMSNTEVSRKLLGSMAFPLPAPMCRRPDLMEESIKLDVHGEVPAEVTQGEFIHVKICVRIEKSRFETLEPLPLRFFLEQSGKRTYYPSESGIFISINRPFVRDLLLVFEKPGDDLIAIGVDYVGRGPGCFYPLYRLTKRYHVKVTPRKHKRVVELHDLRRMVSDIRDLSLDNQEYLKKLSQDVLRSSKLVEEIDATLNKDLPSLRKDIRKWMVTAEKSKLLSRDERKKFLQELNEVLKLSSTAKMMLTLPLLPGFVQFRKELKIDTDWNKWLGKLRSVFKRE